MTLMREWLTDLQGRGSTTARRLDGTPRRRNLPPPPKPNLLKTRSKRVKRDA